MYLVPSLHIQMGMGNTIITEFNEFIDEECETLSLQEENARSKVKHAITKAEALKRRSKINSITANAELGQKRLLICNLKREKKKEKDLTKKSQITMNITLAEKAKATLDEDLKTNIDLVKNAGTAISKYKKDLTEMEKARGTTRKSLTNCVECIFKKLGHQRRPIMGSSTIGS
jgi:hypothetical protein